MKYSTEEKEAIFIWAVGGSIAFIFLSALAIYFGR